MNQNWFTRMLLLYMPVFLIVPAFLFFVFFQHLSDMNHKNAERANQFLAEQAQLMVDSSLSALDQKVTLEMLRNQSVLRYFSEADVSDMTLQVSVMNLLQELKLTNPLIHSIYMVRAIDQSVLNVSTTYAAGQYADSEFIASKLARPNSNWSDVRVYKELESDRGATVVTLTRSVTIFSGKLGMIVVNVSTEALYNLVQQMYNPDVSRLQLYDRQGMPMFQAPGAVEEAAPGGEGDIQSVAQSAYTGWTAETGIQNAKTVNFILSLSNIWFVLGIALFILSIVWIVYVTRQNYRPIRNLVDQLQRLSPESPDSRQEGTQAAAAVYKNEFTFIDSRLKSMIGQNTRFQEQLAKDLGVKRNFFIYELLEGTRSIDMASWAAEADNYGLPRQFGRQQVFVLEIDRRAEWSTRFSLEQQAAHKQLIEEAVDEQLKSSGYEVWQLWISEYQMAAIIMEQPSAAGQLSAIALVESCQAAIRLRLSGEVACTVGLGEPVEHPENLRDSYQEALEALQFKAAGGGGGVIAYAGAPQSQEQVYGYFQKVDRIVDAFKLAEPRWLAELEALFAALAGDRISRRGLESVLRYLLFYMDKAVGGMHADYAQVWREQTLPRLNEALKEAEWIGEASSSFGSLLGQYAELVNAKRESKSQGSLMKELKAYIEQDFTNPELSLDFLQDKFGVSGKYLSRLFKEEYGMKFVDFLIELRIAEGKRLLAHTNLTVQEITERLGYSSPISFARTFKKIVGVPPADYRRSKDTQ